jgi:hypothetical protein
MFKDAPNTMVITTKKIINREDPILIVFHDKEDGMWQFLDGNDTNENDAAIISLAEIESIDSSINAISDLPLGWVAWKEHENAEWESQVQE